MAHNYENAEHLMDWNPNSKDENVNTNNQHDLAYLGIHGEGCACVDCVVEILENLGCIDITVEELK
jgi:hypothetical protein